MVEDRMYLLDLKYLLCLVKLLSVFVMLFVIEGFLVMMRVLFIGMGFGGERLVVGVLWEFY